MSLKEIYRSELIVKLKTFLKNNIELTTITSPEPDQDSVILHSFIHENNNEDTIHHITISQNAVEVITFLSGYISHSLLKSIDCEECKIALNIDPVSSIYLDEYNKEVSSYQHLHSTLTHRVHSPFLIIWN